VQPIREEVSTNSSIGYGEHAINPACHHDIQDDTVFNSNSNSTVTSVLDSIIENRARCLRGQAKKDCQKLKDIVQEPSFKSKTSVEVENENTSLNTSNAETQEIDQ